MLEVVGAHREGREGKGPKRPGLGVGASCQSCNRSPSLLLKLRGYAPSAPWSCQGGPEVRCTRCGRQGAHGTQGETNGTGAPNPSRGTLCKRTSGGSGDSPGS